MTARATSLNCSKICPEEICKRNAKRSNNMRSREDILHHIVDIIYQTNIKNDESLEETFQQIENYSENN